MATTLSKTQNKEIVSTHLTQCLANSAVLYIKTLNYHWNMSGPEFFMFHRLLEEQYQDLASALDEIAERLRALGLTAPATMSEFLKLSTFKEGESSLSQNAMIQSLINDHEKMTASLNTAILEATNAEDPGTADLFTKREQVHAKAAWLLKSNLKKEMI